MGLIIPGIFLISGLAVGAGALIAIKRSKISPYMAVDDKKRNVFSFLLISGFLAGNVFKALSSGHPWTLTCYECRACMVKCPKKLDPSRFVVAARTGNPEMKVPLISKDGETIYLPARDAAKQCIGCKLCEKTCPISLPITNAIEDLKDDLMFG
jgi:ferredoxin